MDVARDIVLAVAAASLALCLGRGFVVDRLEDRIQLLLIEEKKRMWRLRTWRQSLPAQQRAKYKQALGNYLRAVRPKLYNRDIEASLFAHAKSDKVLHERELIWAQGAKPSSAAGATTDGWHMVTAHFLPADASFPADHAIVSTRLAVQLGLIEAGADAAQPPPTARRSWFGGPTAPKPVNISFSVAGLEFTSPAIVRDVEEMGGTGNGGLGLPDSVLQQLKQKGFHYKTFPEHYKRGGR